MFPFALEGFLLFMRIVSSVLACLYALAPTVVFADSVAPFGMRAMPGQIGRPTMPTPRWVSPSVSMVTDAGRLVANISIGVQSQIKPSDVIECAVTASFTDVASNGTTFRSIYDSDTVAATRSGSAATCSVPIPYAWSLANPSQDMVSIDYSITNVSSSNTADFPMRSSNQTISVIPVPKSGATTTFSIKATI